MRRDFLLSVVGKLIRKPRVTVEDVLSEAHKPGSVPGMSIAVAEQIAKEAYDRRTTDDASLLAWMRVALALGVLRLRQPQPTVDDYMVAYGLLSRVAERGATDGQFNGHRVREPGGALRYVGVTNSELMKLMALSELNALIVIWVTFARADLNYASRVRAVADMLDRVDSPSLEPWLYLAHVCRDYEYARMNARDGGGTPPKRPRQISLRNLYSFQDQE